MTVCHFWVQNGALHPKNFFGKAITVIKFSCTLWTLPLSKTKKKLLEGIQSSDIASFLGFGTKITHFPKRTFFEKSLM